VRNRALAWAAGALGGLAAWRVLTRRKPPAPVVAPPPVDPRADELRRKLDESRTMADERDEFEGAETTVDEAEAPMEPDARRRSVHEQGRAAVEQMRGGSPDPES
jgi:hypothetical protein